MSVWNLQEETGLPLVSQKTLYKTFKQVYTIDSKWPYKGNEFVKGAYWVFVPYLIKALGGPEEAEKVRLQHQRRRWLIMHNLGMVLKTRPIYSAYEKLRKSIKKKKDMGEWTYAWESKAVNNIVTKHSEICKRQVCTACCTHLKGRGPDPPLWLQVREQPQEDPVHEPPQAVPPRRRLRP